MRNRIRFAGYVPREKIIEYYTSAYVFILPSFSEGMSIVVLEAIASGLPIIMTRTGGSGELVEEGVNGYTFDWSDTETLISNIIRLVRDRELVRRMGSASCSLGRQMGAAARRKAEQFSWETVAERHQEMFMKMGNQT